MNNRSKDLYMYPMYPCVQYLSFRAVRQTTAGFGLDFSNQMCYNQSIKFGENLCFMIPLLSHTKNSSRRHGKIYSFTVHLLGKYMPYVALSWYRLFLACFQVFGNKLVLREPLCASIGESRANLMQGSTRRENEKGELRC